MRMNISVPDALAEEIRKREIPISAVCQRALRDEVNRLRVIEDADDILVYVESEQASPDPTTWPRFDAAKPMLIYKRYPVGRHLELGWVLEYQQGDEPGDNPTDYFIPGDQDAPPIGYARKYLRQVRGDMEEITVDVGEPSSAVGFTGRWVVEPDADETRTDEPGYDAGAYWGVALTRRGRIAVFTAHCNDAWPASLHDYDSLYQAAAHAPADIIALAADELGEKRVLWRNI